MKKVCYLVALGEYEYCRVFTTEEKAEEYKKHLEEYCDSLPYTICDRPFIEETALDLDKEEYPWISGT